MIDTTEGEKSVSDSKSLRRAALLRKVAYFTTATGAVAGADATAALKAGNLEVKPLQR